MTSRQTIIASLEQAMANNLSKEIKLTLKQIKIKIQTRKEKKQNVKNKI